MSKNVLLRSLPRIAARVLHNTHVGRSTDGEKFDLIATAYGKAAVEEDFEKWCLELLEKGEKPRYPLSQYVKVVDERLGGGFVEPSRSQFDVNDPRITPITSKCYALTGYLPSPKVVLTLLSAFPSEEILAALEEYVSPLTDRELRPGAKQFFTEGGAAAVIHARRERT